MAGWGNRSKSGSAGGGTSAATTEEKNFLTSTSELAWGNDRDPLNQAIDISAIESNRSESRYSDREIQDLAERLARGETDLLNPIVVEKVGFEKYRVVAGEKEYFAVRRAKQLNPSFETAETFLVRPGDVASAKRQLNLFKNDRNKVNARGDLLKIDIADIRTTVKPKTASLSAQSKSLLASEGNLVPVVLRKQKGGTFEVVSGHQIYHAARRAKSQNAKFETVNAVVID